MPHDRVVFKNIYYTATSPPRLVMTCEPRAPQIHITGACQALWYIAKTADATTVSMVRIKHRYLLVNILYPGSDDATSGESFIATNDLPWSVRIRQPTSDKVNAKVLVNMIRRGIEDLFGDYGSGMIAGSLIGGIHASLILHTLTNAVKYFSAATSTAIIRVARAHYRMLWASLSFVTKLPSGQPCVFQVVRVSGTIKKSEEEAIRRARLCIIRAHAGSNHGLIEGRGTGTDDSHDVDMLGGIEDDDDDDE